MKNINMRLTIFALVLALSSQAAIGVPTTLAYRQADHREKEAFAETRKVAIRSYATPDLRILQFLFAPTDNKVVRVQVVNSGNAVASACRLVLTVRKINGVAVGRQTHVNVPALAAGKTVWLNINAKNILPNNVSLESTTFRLNVDATEIVNEIDENNNEIWHGLSATAAIGQAIGEVASDGGEAAPGKPETSDTQQLSAEPNQQKKPPAGCVAVSKRWFVCGSFKNKTVGGGFRFNKLDPNGRFIVSRTYKDCADMAADNTIPADIRKKAADPCKQALHLAASESTVK